MATIMAHLGAPMSDLVGKFYPLSLAGEDAVLARANHQGAVQPTPLFARLSLLWMPIVILVRRARQSAERSELLMACPLIEQNRKPILQCGNSRILMRG